MQSSRASERPESEREPEKPSQPEEEQRLQAELGQMEDRYKRALADLDNYRKRSERDVEWRVQEEREALLRDWLEALDSVERALRMHPGDQGLQAVLAQMEEILERERVTRLGTVGEPFDPELHQAVDVRISAQVPDRTIIEVTRSGFALRDRVLRPAEVVVSRRPTAV